MPLLLAFKEDVLVDLLALDPDMVRVLRVAMLTAPPLVDDTLLVTSQCDGKHRGSDNRESLHYVGRAWDFRWAGKDRIGAIISESGQPGRAAEKWCHRIRSVLGPDYDVVFKKDHIHVEIDPK